MDTRAQFLLHHNPWGGQDIKGIEYTHGVSTKYESNKNTTKLKNI